MTDQTPPPHLDDEDLSALLDGEAGDERATTHLASCASCTARQEALVGARDALRGATVAPLAGDLLDRLVATALAAPAEAVATSPSSPLTTIDRPRRRRLSTPPPAWLLGAVASIAVLAGLAGVLRSGGGNDDEATSLSDAALRAEESGGDAFDQGAVENEAAPAVDPELVTADLGDISDAASLTAALDAPNAQAFSAGRTVAGDATAEDDAEAAQAAPTTQVAPTAGGSATAAGAAPDGARAQCRAEAEAAGGGRLGPLQATAVLRWEGRPAEVLVFALAEPAEGFSRQALVLARPGCALLADPRL